ncbi:hypothetical protein V8054_000575 [Vibrio parahaemolyticus]
MFNVSQIENEEIYTVGYVHKTHLNVFQIWPVPEDLDNYYEVPFDASVSYAFKIYNPETKSWEEDLEERDRVRLFDTNYQETIFAENKALKARLDNLETK